MHSLTNQDYKLFCSLVKVSQKSLRNTLKAFLKNQYDQVYATEDYLYAVGDIPIALCAHMDTVFNTPPRNIYYDKEQGVIWSPDGLGADDRAGIFSIIQILNKGYRPTILFCADEERGALGAEQLILDFKSPINPLNFIIELDRCGTNDCVFYDCLNKEFINYIEDFGFIESFGTFSDISEICPAWGTAGVNLSIGYENEHSKFEILRTGPMLATIKKVEKILSCNEWPTFEYIHSPYSYFNSYLTEWDYPNFGNNNNDYYYCDKCGLPLHSYELIPATSIDGKIKYYCPDCCSDSIEWCYGCGEAFEKGIISKSGLCSSCEDKYKKKKGK